jgi:hypothetical protein
MRTIYIAFYTAKGNLLDTLIRFWTKGTTSHVEFLIEGIMYGAVPFKGTRKTVDIVITDYELFPISVTDEELENILEYCEDELGCDYDWSGIFLSQIINAGHQSTSKWFCSEFVLAALLKAEVIHGYYVPNKFSPEDLLKLLQYTFNEK